MRLHRKIVILVRRRYKVQIWQLISSYMKCKLHVQHIWQENVCIPAVMMWTSRWMTIFSYSISKANNTIFAVNT